MNLRIGCGIPGWCCIWLFLPGLSWLILSCERDTTNAPPVVETTVVSDIGLTSLTAHGTLVKAGDEGVSQHGFCWSAAPSPKIEDDNCTLLGHRSDTGDFTSDIQGLDQNTTYYIRAYAVNGAGSAYGKEIVAKTGRELTVPIVATSGVNTVTEYSAIAGGVVRDDGGSDITSYGICWDTLQDPTIEGTHKAFSEGSGPFSITIKELELRTIYYVRAFAINSTGLAYGNEVMFRTNDSPVTDIDGNVYPTVVIGKQIWMARNLTVTRYADGTPVPYTPDNYWWDSLQVDEKGYCYYNNSTARGNTYGALYTWSAAVNGVDSLDPDLEHIQGVCPAGWHLPGDGEWKELEIHLGMSPLTADSEGWRGDIGGKLKSTGREFWLIPNEGATNETRFTALPAGDRFPKGDFFNLYYSTFFWTSSNYDQNHALARGLGYYVTTMYRGHSDSKKYGFSVRCVRDD
jgi:uncharacterized protein (TIGR02145 family)